MTNKFKLAAVLFLSSALLLAGCSTQSKTNESKTSSTETADTSSQKTSGLTKGQDMTAILSATNWQGTRVYDKDDNDLTKENADFIGLAKYEGQSGRYEFFDANTKKSRGDEGIFFVTNDGAKRILISQTKDYQAIVEMTDLNKDIFTYKRMGTDASGADVEVFVEHKPYSDSELTFTTAAKELNTETGTIETATNGTVILGDTLWNGTVVLDQDGNDVTEYNSNLISLAKFGTTNNKYEFFDLNTGDSRGDFGYFDVINHNKVRAHVSLGENKYGAALEITELNAKKFTYKRTGEDKDGKEIIIFVEHEAYTGKFTPEFTF